jgi:DNA invertase Pin-like site-specific DNA recombinase
LKVAIAVQRRRENIAMTKQPRSSQEVAQGRQDLRERTNREIDELYRCYMSRLPEDCRNQLTLLYARYSTRFQDSIGDQVRALLEYALQQGLFVPRDLIFFDLAVRGAKRSREGLDQAEARLRQKKAGTLLLFSTSRLFRKIYHTLAFVDQIHRGLGVRCIFAKSGVDTDDKKQWEQLLAMRSLMDQFVVSMHVDHIHAAHEGLLGKQLVFGTISFGYVGDPIDGEPTRLGRPRCRIEILPLAANVVRNVYYWYVEVRLALARIVQKLNSDPSIPLPPCARSGRWTKNAVKNLLKNTRYRGLWRYGVMETYYVPDRDYFRQRERSKPLAEFQIEELRIIDDATWYAAQALLGKKGNNGGRQPAAKNRKIQPKLLNGLLFCPGHGDKQRLHVAGLNGRAMECPVCHGLPAEQRYLYSDIDRVWVTQKICEKIQELIVSDGELPKAVVEACRQEAKVQDAPRPARIAELRASIGQLDRSIEATRRSVGESLEDQDIAQRLISRLQSELAGLRAELEQRLAAGKCKASVPTEQEVQKFFGRLADELVAAATSDDIELVDRAREVIRRVTGGVIEIHQLGERKRHWGWVQATFALDFISYFVEATSGHVIERPTANQVVIDLKRPRRENPKIQKAWELYKQDLLHVQIASELDCTESNVTHLLRKAAAQHGEEYVNGHARRAKLQKRQREPMLCEIVAPDVLRLLSERVPKCEIAERLGISHDTVTKICRDAEKPLTPEPAGPQQPLPDKSDPDGQAAA